MNQARVGLLVAAALMAMPLMASAQPKAAQPPKGDSKEINLDEEGAGEQQPAGEEQPAEPTGEETPPPDDGGEGLGDICKIDPSACPSVDMEKAAQRALNAEMYAVQQIYALRNRRFEITP